MSDVRVRIYSEKHAGRIAALMASTHPKFDVQANKVAQRVKARAVLHKQSGDYIDSIKVKKIAPRKAGIRGVRDRLVYSDDKAAHIIEYGFVSKSGKRVPGQHIFSGVLGRRK